MADFDAIRDGLQGAIPFNNHLGLEVVEVAEGRGVVRLPEDDKLANHVGSQHAGGLFAAGEAASGGAFTGSFADHLGGITPLAKSAEIEYRKLAKGPVTAVGSLSEDVGELLSKLDEEGRVEFPIGVELKDQQDNVVATMTVHWHVRRNS